MGSLVENNPLLEDELENQEEDEKLYTGDGSVDIHGNPAIKNQTGNWRACPFILGNECCERLAYYGIAKNLVTYLTSKLHEGNVSAARNVSLWAGTCYLSPIIGAILADAHWGRYWTIAIFSTIYMFGMCTVALSATIPGLKPADCVGSVCPPATLAQYGVFFVGLYLMALGTGGIKPCVSSFGADQFDDTDPSERVKKGSFFNWFYFSINIGSLVASTVLVYIQDNAGWAIGFFVPAVFMGVAIGFFFLGTRLYRFQRPGQSPITRICQVLVAAFRNRNVVVPKDISLLFETSGNGQLDHTHEFKCLDRACVAKNGDVSSPWRLCTVTQVEEVKIFARIFPIWASGILYFSVYAQTSTMFIEQAMMMDTKLGSFTIPPASLSTADVISVICWVPVYDKLIVPVARRFTGKERGFSDLQRMGIGLIVSVSAMVAAALVEIQRLRIAAEIGLTEKNVAVPMSVLWVIPQYMLVGASEVFTSIGQLQFFYDQSPDSMRSLCAALALATTALGNYLSSFVLTVVTYLTTRNGDVGWIPDNLNEGHLDYFYWLLALFGVANFGFYVFCSSRYKQKRSH